MKEPNYDLAKTVAELREQLQTAQQPITCPKCGLPRFYGPSGYAGPQCGCYIQNVGGVRPSFDENTQLHIQNINKKLDDLIVEVGNLKETVSNLMKDKS